jgi:predicted signal transduction protein with EAL and GGDEF domain
VVAEGIETEQAWALLSQMGCDSGQGYLMSRPIPANEFGAWSRRWTLNNTARDVASNHVSRVHDQPLTIEMGEDA